MKLGFIGTGNMASAMMGGIIKNNIVLAQDIIGADLFAPSRDKVKETLGIQVTANNLEVVETSDVFVLSVKPQYYEAVINEIKDAVREDQIVITIAPGKTLAWLEKKFGKAVKIVRTMPNTPAMVGAGMTAACRNQYVTDEDMAQAIAILEAFSVVEVIPENLMDVIPPVSGSSPAYVFVMIESMADAAVSGGMPRAQAYRFAAQAVLGSAKMVLETGKHPAELKDMVCSPAGSTIEAIRVLDELGFRTAIFEAMKACEEKSRSL